MLLTVIILSILCLLSVAVNVVLIWYNRRAVEKILFVSDNIGDTMGLIKEYQEHLNSLHELEMFYGDATLQGLMDHTSFIVEEIKAFEQIYSLTREEGELNLDDGTKPEPETEKEEA
jgi:hypothetical protein